MRQFYIWFVGVPNSNDCQVVVCRTKSIFGIVYSRKYQVFPHPEKCGWPEGDYVAACQADKWQAELFLGYPIFGESK